MPGATSDKTYTLTVRTSIKYTEAAADESPLIRCARHSPRESAVAVPQRAPGQPVGEQLARSAEVAGSIGDMRGSHSTHFGHDDWAPFAPGMKTLSDGEACAGVLSAHSKRRIANPTH